jgi:hypothetical protein
MGMFVHVLLAKSTPTTTPTPPSPPQLTISDRTGQPGSAFTIRGSNYLPDAQATVTINGVQLGTLITDATGMLTVTLETAINAAPGYYEVTIASSPQRASTGYTLDADEPLREAEAGSASILVPSTVSPAAVYLPLVHKAIPPTATPTPTSTPIPTSTPTPTSTPIPTSTPEPVPYDGTWRGTTSQGKSVLFTVEGNSITYFEIQAQSGVCQLTYTFESSTRINGTSFTESSPVFNDGSFVEVEGTFNSGSLVSGTLTGSEPDCGGAINVTWNATKQ